MKLGVLTLWTNGMSATSAPAPREISRSGDVAPLAERAPETHRDDVIGADAKPLFAVDDLAYAIVAPPAPPSKPRRKVSRAAKAARASSSGKKRAVARA